MDEDSFTPSQDVLGFSGPGGSIAVTDWTWVTPQTLELRFSPQTTSGDYNLILGPEILDMVGIALDVDNDDRIGEPKDDRFAASWSLVGPKIVSHVPSGTIPALVPLDHFDISFNSTMDQSSFSLVDVQAISGPSGPISANGYVWLDERTLRIAFEPLTEMGEVSVTIGPQVHDQWGNLLDQNQNTVGGEADDTWTGTVTRSISGIIDQDFVIPSNAGTVFVGGTVTVATGATLAIEPGVTLKFGPGAGLIISGRLDVNASYPRAGHPW